jgi:hypothetical protein
MIGFGDSFAKLPDVGHPFGSALGAFFPLSELSPELMRFRRQF